MYAVAFVLAVVTLFASWIATEKTSMEKATPAATVNYQAQDAEGFIAYRNAVTNYLKVHPTFRGTVPATAINVSLPSPSITGLTNVISSTASGTGAVILCVGQLHAGAISTIMRLSDNDASFGVSVDGVNWRTAAGGSSVLTSPSPLPSPVPAGYVVSLIQIGV